MSLDRKQYGVCFLLCILLFALGFLAAVSLTLPDIFLSKGEVQAADGSIVERLRTASTLKLILFNNSRVFLILTLGILTCGILSVIQSFIIGGSIGLVVRLGISQGAPQSLILAALLPHGVFELTAFMVVAALGLYFPMRISRYLKGLAIDWVNEAKTYGLVSFGAYLVLCLAAVIETFLTPSIAAKFLP
jgi:uncharacterized membrane protein SpoIIM required for sporulation